MLPNSFINQVHEQSASYQSLDDARLREIALDLGYEARKVEKIGPLLVRGFALVQTAAERHVGLKHYDVQLAGGRDMCHGHVVEMRTGEGKTLAATLPLFIHALCGRGALLATANDYLARRDAEWMQKIFQTLGMSVGVIQTDMSRSQRCAAYSCSVTYGTMKEFGFDFLRDHSFQRKNQQQQLWYGGSTQAQPPGDHLPVQRDPYFLLIDEADSILIDEARTPMILSAAEDEEAHERQRQLYQWSATAALQHFEEDVHYWYDKEKRKVDLTPDGTARVRELAKPKSLDGVGLPEMYDFVERDSSRS